MNAATLARRARKGCKGRPANPVRRDLSEPRVLKDLKETKVIKDLIGAAHG